MALSYAPLSTFALCDAATKKIASRMKGLTARTAALDLADDRAATSQESAMARLTKVNAEIVEATFKLTQPGLDAATTAVLTDDLDDLRIQRRRLERRLTEVAGLDDFMTDVDAEEVAVRVAKLQEVLNGIATHRATLSA